MIVVSPIGAVKIGNVSSRLTVGKKVPENVLSYWKSTKQLEGLIKAGCICNDNDYKINDKKEEPKKEVKGKEIESESIFKNKN